MNQIVLCKFSGGDGSFDGITVNTKYKDNEDYKNWCIAEQFSYRYVGKVRTLANTRNPADHYLPMEFVILRQVDAMTPKIQGHILNGTQKKPFDVEVRTFVKDSTHDGDESAKIALEKVSTIVLKGVLFEKSEIFYASKHDIERDLSIWSVGEKGEYYRNRLWEKIYLTFHLITITMHSATGDVQVDPYNRAQ